VSLVVDVESAVRKCLSLPLPHTVSEPQHQPHELGQVQRVISELRIGLPISRTVTLQKSRESGKLSVRESSAVRSALITTCKSVCTSACFHILLPSSHVMYWTPLQGVRGRSKHIRLP